LQSSHCNNFLLNDKSHRLLFVGNFAYEPNIDAALYFSNLIFPLILKHVPNTKLLLVGNAPPPQILSLKSNELIKVTGYVDSLYPFYRAADVVICPLRVGGGVKVKILEALAAGKAIVSTSVGAQGLDWNNCEPVIIADDILDFANKVIWLLLNPSERQKQEQKASSYAENIPNWNEASEEFAKCYVKMLDYRHEVKC
jgi:glycosyltransferase involved in cell wall biosynthesis